MRVVHVQFAPWDKVYYFSPNSLELEKGDRVIVKTDLSMEMGEVVGFSDIAESDFLKRVKNKEQAADSSEKKEAVLENNSDQIVAAEEKIESTIEIETEKKEDKKEDEVIIKPILRKAAMHDLEKLISHEEKKKALEYCRKTKEALGLPMKFVDAHFSFDGSRITFAFIADGRIDFRELVKDLTRHFGRTIRLQQIGIRDEAKIKGDFGHCSLPLCCRRVFKDFTSITSEMAEMQQCSHRGSERISGICGRLMCCLAYEQKGYEDLAKKMPPLGAKVNVDGKKGVVVSHHILKQTVGVEFPGEKGENSIVVEVDLNRKKK